MLKNCLIFLIPLCFLINFQLHSADSSDLQSQVALELAKMDQELDTTNFGVCLLKKICSIELLSYFDEREKNYINFLREFIKEASPEIDDASLMRVDWLNDEQFFEHYNNLWQQWYRDDYNTSRLKKIAKENAIPFTISASQEIRYLLKEVALNPVIEEWKNFNCNDSSPTDEDFNRINKIFYDTHPLLSQRTDFAFNLVHFFHFGVQENLDRLVNIRDRGTLKERLQKENFFINLKILENAEITLADIIRDIKGKTRVVFLDLEKPKHLISLEGKNTGAMLEKQFLDELNSIKIFGYSAGIWGYAEWDERHVQSLNQKVRLKLKKINDVLCAIPYLNLYLTLPEIRLLAGQTFLGPQVKSDLVFRSLFEKFSTISGFNKYLQIINHFPKAFEIISSSNQNSFAEELLRHFHTLKNSEQDQIEIALTLNEGKEADELKNLWQSIKNETKNQDTAFFKVGEAMASLHKFNGLSLEEKEIFNALQQFIVDFNANNGIVAQPILFSDKKSKNKVKKNKGKGKKLSSQRNAKGQQSSYKKKNQARKKNTSANISEADLEKFYPHLFNENQILFVSHPVNLESDRIIYRRELLEILKFRKTHRQVLPQETISVSSVALENEEKNENNLVEQDNFFSLLQNRLPTLNPHSPGYLAVIEKLFEMRQNLIMQGNYITDITQVLYKMRQENIIAHNKYQFALSGFIRLYSDCQKWLIAHPDFIDKGQILSDAWSYLMFDKPAFCDDNAQKIFFEEVRASNEKCTRFLNMFAVSAKEVSSPLVEIFHNQATDWQEQNSLNAQYEISRNTFDMEEKIFKIQQQVEQLMRVFPEAIE